MSNDALKYIDILKGKYIDILNDGGNLRGSSNQKIYIFNNNLKSKYLTYLKQERKFQQSIILNEIT